MKLTKLFTVYCVVAFSRVYLADSLNCSEPAPVANAYRKWEGGTAGSYVTYSCLSSYVHTSGHLSRVCNSTDGTYSGEPPVCTLECSAPADVVGASRVYSNDTSEGSSATYTCWNNYHMFEYSETRTCSVFKGGWSPLPLICSEMDNLAIEHNTSQSSTFTIRHNTTDNSTVTIGNNTADNSNVTTGNNTADNSTVTAGNNTADNSTVTAGNNTADNSTVTAGNNTGP
ncbi:CUB and sushi domain-containing protein 2-like [Gigantopelta aegis]|uniref:CUB and sushi domain-containing protein 2-like n=1 Tax=Gigantopelta aegis TaxID=1735272 RepID=UPI001B88AD92|nr:CUB and sushi domain-containing protein 2-like [Gigantopelta aegis]